MSAATDDGGRPAPLSPRRADGWTRVGLVWERDCRRLEIAQRYIAARDPHDGWEVVYHGTQARGDVLRDIVDNGLKVQGGKATARNGARHGRGLYCSPSLEFAAKYASPTGELGDVASARKVVVECRVRPGSYQRHSGDVWRVALEKDLRPVAMLWK